MPIAIALLSLVEEDRSVPNLPAFEPHVHGIARPQRDRRGEPKPWARGQVESAHGETGREHQQCFSQREMVSDADPRSRSERHVDTARQVERSKPTFGSKELGQLEE